MGYYVEGVADQLAKTSHKQSLHPNFFQVYGIPDNLDAKIGLLTVHSWLFLHKMQTNPSKLPVGLDKMFANALISELESLALEEGVHELKLDRATLSMVNYIYRMFQALEVSLNCNKQGEVYPFYGLIHTLIFSQDPSVDPKRIVHFFNYLTKQFNHIDQIPTHHLVSGDAIFFTPPDTLPRLSEESINFEVSDLPKDFPLPPEVDRKAKAPKKKK